MKELSSRDLEDSIRFAASVGTNETNTMAVALKDLHNAISLARAAGYAAKLGAVRTASAQHPVIVLLMGSPPDLAATERDLSTVDFHVPASAK